MKGTSSSIKRDEEVPGLEGDPWEEESLGPVPRLPGVLGKGRMGQLEDTQ